MKLTYLLTGVLVLLLTGCSDKKREAEQQAFFPDQRTAPSIAWRICRPPTARGTMECSTRPTSTAPT